MFVKQLPQCGILVNCFRDNFRMQEQSVKTSLWNIL